MRRRTLIVIAVALLATSPAYANVAAPFAAFAWPISLLILLPVIAIEAWVAVSVLRVSLDRGLKIATQANLYSTGIGLIATAPAALFVPDMAVLGVLGPLGFSHEPSRRLWLALAAGLLVAAPSYLVSVWLEERVVRRLLDPERAPRARRWAWTANGWSYLLIWALYACYFQYASESWYRMSQKVRQTICLSNLKWIARATLGHRTDPPGAVPQVVDFAVLTRLVAAERKRGHDVLHCPDSKRGYLFNTGLSGVPIAAIRERSQTVMIRDAVPHGDGLLCVVFADGTARAIPPTDVGAARGRFR